MISTLIKDKDSELYLEFPHLLRRSVELIYPPDYPPAGIVFLEASLDAIVRPFRSFNPEFLQYLNAAETLWTILMSPELRTSPELSDVQMRCHDLLHNTPTTNLPPIYI